jgi:hypothetical protein
MRYSSKGIVQLSVPFSVENGSYSRNNDRITIKFRDQASVEYIFKRIGNKLTINDIKNNKATEFQLFEY